MNLDLHGSIGIALLLGLRHGLDADHLAAIDGIARLNVGTGRPGLARASGLLFALGHGIVVLLAALWIQGAAAQLPGWLGPVGSTVSIVLLSVLGIANLRQAIGREPRPAAGWAGMLLRAPLAGHPLGGLLIGALFACSFDTLTLAAWFGAASTAAAPPPLGSIVAMAAVFVGGMMACDALNGVWVTHLVQRSTGFAVRSRRLFAALVAASALAVAGLGALRLAYAPLDAGLERQGLWVSAGLAGALLLGFTWARRSSARSLSPARPPSPSP